MEFKLGGTFYKQHQRFTEKKKFVHLISSDEPSALDTNPILVHVLVSEIWKIKLHAVAISDLFLLHTKLDVGNTQYPFCKYNSWCLALLCVK